MMNPLEFPALMGLFCTGYVLHRAWGAWERHRILKSVKGFENFRLSIDDETGEVIWHEWSPKALSDILSMKGQEAAAQ